ncbi:MAG TPA: NADH-quinone oxidoreductase subunit C [bacterium]|nr:NADH-quinone oxidoreductase subunit C [bacterium]
MKVLETLKEKLGERIKDIKIHNERRIYLTVEAGDIKECAKIVFRELDARYIIASGADNFDSFEILYHFGFDSIGTVISLRVFLARENPGIDSLSDVIPGISYIEREMWELLGINFAGHPGLSHFLLRDDWPEGNFPLRKSIKTDGANSE